jgi:hypothetical protein
VKVLRPTRLMREAADVLRPVRGEVVVIGATALEAALAGTDARSAATIDVDCAVGMNSAEAVIDQLESAGLTPSDEPHERGFTWVREDMKVQLIRPAARVVRPPVSGLVVNTNLSLTDRYREAVAFDDAPEEPRLLVARAAAILALKGRAFGRTRPTGGLVERDYHDAYLLVAHVGDEIAAEYNGTDDGELRGLIRKALDDLVGEQGREAVRNQATRLESDLSPREADVRLQRAVKMLRGALR